MAGREDTEIMINFQGEIIGIAPLPRGNLFSGDCKENLINI
jgi:hypothetical protein